MHRYQAKVVWNRNGAKFTDNRYSRAHEWQFDGGARVAASASPLVVPLPLSVSENVDPEEAFVASASSCHMLFFLSFAARRGYVIDQYIDDALGFMEKNAEGKTVITKIVLRPHITFSEGPKPSPAEIEELHHEAHNECYIANSIKSDIVVE